MAPTDGKRGSKQPADSERKIQELRELQLAQDGIRSMTRRLSGRTIANAWSWEASSCSDRSPRPKIGDEVMLHDPTLVTDGIEVSPNDQIVAVRRGAYLVSVAERTGGWQRRFNFEADLRHAESAGRA